MNSDKIRWFIKCFCIQIKIKSCIQDLQIYFILERFVAIQQDTSHD